MKLAHIVLIVALLSACQSRSGTSSATSAPQSKSVKVGNFTYTCGAFSSQIKSRDEVRALTAHAREIIRAERERNFILVSSFRSALENRDFLRLEQMAVEYECGK